MPSCELCGRNMKGRGRNVTIEGAEMLVCPQCAAKFGGQSPDASGRPSYDRPSQPSWIGSSISRPTTAARPRTISKPVTPKRMKPRPESAPLLDDMALIEDYADTIRKARQKKNMSQDELAQKVGERISTLQSIESGRLKPTRKTIRGLERELDISLLEPIDAVPLRITREGDGAGPTLGDIVKVKKKKSQKSD